MVWYKKIEPQYAFGYGLSYTAFNLSDIKINTSKFNVNDTITVSCNVTNSGNFEGSEVVQVYIGKNNSKVKRALKELKGFEKVNLKKGESHKVNIEIPVNSLAYYNEEKSNWDIEKGEYIIYVGNASNSITKTLVVNIK